MRKPLGRIAAAVLAGALITFAAAPAAFAQDTDVSTTSVAETPTETSSPESSTTSSSATDSATSAPASSEESSTTTSAPAVTETTSTSAETTESSKPTETSASDTETWPPDPYVDDTAYGFDLGDGTAVVIIACAGGEPTGFSSPQFDVLEGAYQEEQDGRYWDYLIQLHDGVTFDETIQASWTCPKAGGGSSTGSEITPGAGSSDSGAWQASNGGDAQVAYAPKAGVETGFGGTARF